MQHQQTTKITTVTQDSGKALLTIGVATLAGYLFLGIGLLAVVSALVLGLLLAAYFLSRASLKRIRFEISTPQTRTRVGEPVATHVTIANPNRYLPVFYPTISIRQKDTLRIHAFQFQGIIPAKSEVSFTAEPSFESRGLQRLEAFAPRSQFPFALHESIANAGVESNNIIVWPHSLHLNIDAIFNDPPRKAYDVSGEDSLVLNSNDATRIRNYVPGDPKPRINWKLSAKRDHLTVIEPRRQQLHKYELHLDTSVKLWKSNLAFERMLGLVSTLVSELFRRKLLQGISINSLFYPLLTNPQTTRFYDVLAQLQTENRDPAILGDEIFQRSQQKFSHLWILPAPHSSIILSSVPEEIESTLRT